MPKVGKLIGPYARQVTGSKLKFWFAFRGAETIRYEVTIDKFDRQFAARRRPIYPSPAPTHSSNFAAYFVPDDLTSYPGVAFPRHKGDTIASAAASLLTGEDVADATRTRLVGILPATD